MWWWAGGWWENVVVDVDVGRVVGRWEWFAGRGVRTWDCLRSMHQRNGAGPRVRRVETGRPCNGVYIFAGASSLYLVIFTGSSPPSFHQSVCQTANSTAFRAA